MDFPVRDVNDAVEGPRTSRSVYILTAALVLREVSQENIDRPKWIVVQSKAQVDSSNSAAKGSSACRLRGPSRLDVR